MAKSRVVTFFTYLTAVTALAMAGLLVYNSNDYLPAQRIIIQVMTTMLLIESFALNLYRVNTKN